MGGVGFVFVMGFLIVFYEFYCLCKGVLFKFFFCQQMFKFEGEVFDFCYLMIDKMFCWFGKEVFDIKEVFNCFIVDVIFQYVFGEFMGFIV